jgi:hypothetical protein
MTLAREDEELRRVADAQVWEAKVPACYLTDGVYPLRVWAQDIDGREAEDTICLRIGAMPASLMERHERDQENALPAWPEHGLFGTQLGPNKNGRKW